MTTTTRPIPLDQRQLDAATGGSADSNPFLNGSSDPFQDLFDVMNQLQNGNQQQQDLIAAEREAALLAAQEMRDGSQPPGNAPYDSIVSGSIAGSVVTGGATGGSSTKGSGGDTPSPPAKGLPIPG